MGIRSEAAGRQDFSTSVYESAVSTLFSPRQAEWEYLWEVAAAPPGKTVSEGVYTVPKGYSLLFKGGFAFSDTGIVQCFYITKTPGVLGSYYMSRLRTFAFMPSSEVKEGHIVTFYFTNNSTRKAYGGISLVGILQKG